MASLNTRWWRRLAALFVAVGVVLSPLRAVAATIPMLAAAVVVVGSSATTRIEGAGSLRGEPRIAPEYVYDAALDGYDGSPNLRVTVGAGAVRAYDGRVEREAHGEGAIYDALTVATAAKGGGGSTALASSPPNDHDVFPQEFRKGFSGRGVDIDKYLVELPENVHLDQLHARNIDTSAGPMNFGPGGIWNENWRQFLTRTPTRQQDRPWISEERCARGISGCP